MVNICICRLVAMLMCKNRIHITSFTSVHTCALIDLLMGAHTHENQINTARREVKREEKTRNTVRKTNSRLHCTSVRCTGDTLFH